MTAPPTEPEKSKSTELCCGKMIQKWKIRKMIASEEPVTLPRPTPKATRPKDSGSCFLQEYPNKTLDIVRFFNKFSVIIRLYTSN